MSVYLSLFLAAFITAVIAVLVHRRLSGARSCGPFEIDISALSAWLGRKVRQGFSMLGPASRERARQVRLRTPKDGFKTPWGW